MKLGVTLGYWKGGPAPDAPALVAEAERLGLDSVWTAEAYGSDAFVPLAWYANGTSTVRLGTNIVQMSARTPAATAMAAITLDHLSGGRFVLGLGASGPQVVEGWYGQPYPKPLARTREYIEILRAVFERRAPVEYQGQHYRLPYDGGTGLGKPLKSTVHPLRADLPVYLAAEGPKNVALAAEIADGWLPFLFSPRADAFYRAALAEGFARPAARRQRDSFEVAAFVPVVIDDDVEAAADRLRPMLALYVGGMGARQANFHRDVLARLGYEAECARIQDHFLAGDRAGAVAAVPTSMVQDVALIGPAAKIRDELPAWRDTVIDTLLVNGPIETVRQLAAIMPG